MRLTSKVTFDDSIWVDWHLVIMKDGCILQDYFQEQFISILNLYTIIFRKIWPVKKNLLILKVALTLQNSQTKIPDHLKVFSNIFSFSRVNVNWSLILNMNKKLLSREKHEIMIPLVNVLRFVKPRFENTSLELYFNTNLKTK